jgi:hypothetical protein
MSDSPFSPAVRTNTAIVLALAGASGSGKTKSALELAVGLAGERGQIAVIDTEGRRALHYADEYRFLHAEWRPPFTPEALGKLLREAERREYAVVIVDSMSDEHEGEGGLCDMAEAEFRAQREGSKNSAAAWARPKASHKLNIVRWLRQARCHVIFCLRADEKVEMRQEERDGRKRTVVIPIGWQPIAEKRLLYDVTTSLLFTPDAPGVPKPIKLYDKHKPFFPPDRQVSREAGRRLAEWAAGGSTRQPEERIVSTPDAERRSPALVDSPSEAPTEPAPRAAIDDETATLVAKQGTEAFRLWWNTLSREHRSQLRPFLSRYQGIAQEADAAVTGE